MKPVQSIAEQDYHIEEGEEENLYRLKRFSPWYTQIQMQMGYAIKVPYCNFIWDQQDGAQI